MPRLRGYGNFGEEPKAVEVDDFKPASCGTPLLFRELEQIDFEEDPIISESIDALSRQVSQIVGKNVSLDSPLSQRKFRRNVTAGLALGLLLFLK